MIGKGFGIYEVGSSSQQWLLESGGTLGSVEVRVDRLAIAVLLTLFTLALNSPWLGIASGVFLSSSYIKYHDLSSKTELTKLKLVFGKFIG